VLLGALKGTVCTPSGLMRLKTLRTVPSFPLVSMPCSTTSSL
jgi:hypothetical protein